MLLPRLSNIRRCNPPITEFSARSHWTKHFTWHKIRRQTVVRFHRIVDCWFSLRSERKIWFHTLINSLLVIIDVLSWYFSFILSSVLNADAMTLGLLQTRKRISALTLTNARLTTAVADSIRAWISTEDMYASVYPDTRLILRKCVHPYPPNSTDYKIRQIEKLTASPRNIFSKAFIWLANLANISFTDSKERTTFIYQSAAWSSLFFL